MSDDLISDDDARIEQRFRELEQQAEIDRLRAEAGRGDQPGAAKNRSGGTSPERAGPEPAGPDTDPLAPLKTALDGDHRGQDQEERFILALCPHCETKNRVSLSKLRSSAPNCGACKRALSFLKL